MNSTKGAVEIPWDRLWDDTPYKKTQVMQTVIKYTLATTNKPSETRTKPKDVRRMMDNKQIMDEAREETTEQIKTWIINNYPMGKEEFVNLADRILALSGKDWEIAVVRKNGIPPEVKEDYPFERLDEQARMIKAGYVQRVVE